MCVCMYILFLYILYTCTFITHICVYVRAFVCVGSHLDTTFLPFLCSGVSPCFLL